jgi:hypothetical protein
MVSLTVMACSVDNLIGSKAVLGIDDGASEGAKDSLKVDGKSEATIALDTGATLTLPKGAVDHDVTIGVERPADSKAIALVESLKSVKAVASAPYVLTPHGTEFAKDVKLEIPVVNNKDRELVVAWLKDESDREWKYLDSPTVENDVATVTLKHFSVVVLLDRARSGLTIDAPDAGADDKDAGAPVQDAGRAADDAGKDEPPDAGADPKQDEDAGSPPAEAGSVTVDATVQTPDASDHADDAGSAFDAGSAETPDASTNPDLDSSAQPMLDAAQGSDSGSVAIDDAGLPDASSGGGSDASQQLPDGCVPYTCFVDQCGAVPDGCGSYVECGNCEVNGGVCGFYEPNLCGPPIY